MTQTALDFTRPFYPDLDYPYNSQKRRMYDLLKSCGMATNSEFIFNLKIFKYTNRVFELRKDLEAHGWTIRAERLQDGIFNYHLERRSLCASNTSNSPSNRRNRSISTAA